MIQVKEKEIERIDAMYKSKCGDAEKALEEIYKLKAFVQQRDFMI